MGEGDRETAAAAVRSRADFNSGAVQAGNLFNYGQSQPAAITGGAPDPIEPFEDPDPLFFGNSWTVILHAHGRLRVTLNNDGNAPAGVGVAQSVVDQVGQRLAQQPFIAGDGNGAGWSNQAEINVALQRLWDPLFSHASSQRNQIQLLELDSMNRFGIGSRQ